MGETLSSTGSLSLAEVAGELDRETLQKLKRECGGLQTLLRNSSQVFQGEGLGRASLGSQCLRTGSTLPEATRSCSRADSTPALSCLSPHFF